MQNPIGGIMSQTTVGGTNAFVPTSKAVMDRLSSTVFKTQGKVYYVHKAGNGTTGLSWENAFTTIAAAITASNATISWSGNLEDNYILIAPGLYAENLTSLPYYSHLIGLGMPGTTTPARVYLTGAAAVAVTTMLGTHIYNMRFEADGAVDIFDTGTLNDSIIENCTFCANDGSVVNGLSTETSTHLIIRNCKFIADSEAGMSYGMYFAGGTNKFLSYADIVGNIITGVDAAGTGMYIHGDCLANDTVVRNNIIKLVGAGTGFSEGATGTAYQYAMYIGNAVFHQAGTGYSVQEDLAFGNMDNNGTTRVAYPTQTW